MKPNARLSEDDFDRGVDAYWQEIGRRPAEVQQREMRFPLLAEAFAARTPPHFTRGEVEEIMRWKHTDARWRNRALDGLRAVSESRVNEVTSHAGAVDCPVGAHRTLKGMASGVGLASISAILAAARPDRFPVIDVFALMALLEYHPEPWHVRAPR
jgi:hypothetical protein